MRNSLSVDLERSARRSDSFKDWSRQQIRDAIRRYKMFLLLIARHPNVCVAPTSDIDAIWHLHMLRPSAYVRDCQRILGFLLDHDGGFGAEADEASVLTEIFKNTDTLWTQQYGESYVDGPLGAVKCKRNCVNRCKRACKT